MWLEDASRVGSTDNRSEIMLEYVCVCVELEYRSEPRQVCDRFGGGSSSRVVVETDSGRVSAKWYQ